MGFLFKWRYPDTFIIFHFLMFLLTHVLMKELTHMLIHTCKTFACLCQCCWHFDLQLLRKNSEHSIDHVTFRIALLIKLL